MGTRCAACGTLSDSMGVIMVRIALAVLIGLLWAGAIPVTMPWTASIFGLALFNFLLVTFRS